MAEGQRPGADETETTNASDAALAAPSPTMERLLAAGSLAFGVIMLIGSRTIALRSETGGFDPRAWPTMIAIAIMVTAGWAGFNAITRRRAQRDVQPATGIGWIRIAIVIGTAAVAVLVWSLGLSFLVIGPVYLLAINWVFGLRGWRGLVLFPLIMAALLFGVFFLLLRIPL